VGAGANSHGMLTILQALSKAHCPKCAVGSGGKSVGYLAHGTATDYIYDVLKVPIVFTWEIWGDLQANTNDCHRMFNPVTKESHDVRLSARRATVTSTWRFALGFPQGVSISPAPTRSLSWCVYVCFRSPL
jgi:hypothetical protein